MKKIPVLLYLIIVIMLVGCTSKMAGIDFDDSLSPCEINEEDIGGRIKVGGLVEFIDQSAPDGWYADLERDRCRVGIWIPKESLDSWKTANPDAFKEDAVLIVEGLLTSQPLPDRPDEFQLIVEPDQPPRLLVPGEDSGSQPVRDLPPCDYGEMKSGDPVIGDGIVLVVDDSAAAGVYLELDEGGCFKRVWVESRFYNAWTGTDRQLIRTGNHIVVNGIYTEVRGESTIDISTPPALK